MPSTQELLDDIFGPKLKVVTDGKIIDHIPALEENPARKEILERILNNAKIKPDGAFERERRTARLSFAFTERERSLFITKFIELREELAAKGTLKQNEMPNLMSVDQFKECWLFARNFHPSNEALETVKEIFSHKKYTSPGASSPAAHGTQKRNTAASAGSTSDYIIDVVDFTRACCLDTEEIDSVPFAVSFLKEERRRFDSMVELLYYIPFLVLFSFILVSLRQLPAGYQLHKAIEDNMFDRRFLEPCTGNDCNERAQRVLKFKGSSVSEPAYFYEWLRTQVTPTVWAGGQDDDADKLVNERLLAIGALRLQQIRIDPSDSARQYDQLFTDSDPSPQEQTKINQYYPKTSPAFTLYKTSPGASQSDWSRAPFNQAAVASAAPPLYLQKGFRHTDVVECGTTILGYLNNYHCSGFIVDLPLNLTKNETLKAINKLQELNWIDSATRLVAVRAIFFNKDYQLFGRFFAGFEIPPGGHWMSLLRVNIFRFFTLAQQETAWIFFFVLLLAWIAWNILNWAVEFTDSVRSSAKALGRPFSSAFDAGISGFPIFISVVVFTSVKKAFIKDPWTIIESANFALFIIVWFWRLDIWTEYSGFDTWNNEVYPDGIEKYSNVNANIDYVESVTVILCYFRLLKTLRVFPILRLVFKSLAQASTDLYGMAFTAGVLIVAFALSGFVLYGALLPEFSSVPYSIVTILRFIIGSYDYDGWESSRNILAPVFLTLLEILLIIVVLEFITAIIADTFGDMSKKQYKKDQIKNVIASDLRSVLTTGVIDSPARNPIAMEITGYFRSFVAYVISWKRLFRNYCCGKKENDMTEDERKAYRRRRMYEDPPVDSALYILHRAALDPQKLHSALEILVERTYTADDAKATEAIFLLYEMMFERESHRNVKEQTTRQLAFTLAASHCDTANLTRHMETAPRDLVSSLINRLGVENYPFLVAVAVHLPHVVAHLPRVTRFVSMFEAHAFWQESVRNENLTDFENSIALEKLGKLDSRVKKLAKVWKKMENSGGGNNKNNNNDDSTTSLPDDHDPVKAVDTAAPENNGNNNNNNNDDQNGQQNDNSNDNGGSTTAVTAAVTAVANKVRALIIDDDSSANNNNNNTTTKNNNNNNTQSKAKNDSEEEVDDDELTTHQRQKMVENLGKSAEDNLRLRALFSGISREAVDAVFDKWFELNDTEKAKRINAFKVEWKRQRESWPSAQSEMIDITYEIRLLFGDDSVHIQRRNELISFFNSIYEGDVVEGLRQEYSRKIMNQGWNERKRKDFNKYVGKYYDQEHIREEVLRENNNANSSSGGNLMAASGDGSSSAAASGDASGSLGFANGSVIMNAINNTSIGSAVLGFGKKVASSFTKLGASQRVANLRRRRAPDGIHYKQLDEFLKEASSDDRAPTHFIPLRIFEAIWKKIVDAELSTEFRNQLAELSEMIFGKTGIPALRKKKIASSNNDNDNKNTNNNHEPDNNQKNTSQSTKKDDDQDDDNEPNIIINADAFYMNCVVSPGAHNLTSVPSNHYKIQHDFLYNSVQLLLYIPFIALFTVLLLLNQNNLATYSSVTVREYVTRPFKSPDMRPFDRISNSDQWRNWVQQSIFDQFLPTTEGQPHLSFSGNTFVVGGVRIRQLRVESVEDCGYPDPGALPTDMNSAYYTKRKQVHFPTFCEPRWAIGFEQKSDLLVNGGSSSGLSDAALAAFKYTASTFCFGQQEGFSGYYSSCEGYTLFFPASQSRTNASKLLDEVMPLWIDASTRALTVDFFIYNFNDNVYVRNLILAETSAGGGWKDADQAGSLPPLHLLAHRRQLRHVDRGHGLLHRRLHRHLRRLHHRHRHDRQEISPQTLLHHRCRRLRDDDRISLVVVRAHHLRLDRLLPVHAFLLHDRPFGRRACVSRSISLRSGSLRRGRVGDYSS
jgi:hypothetical protein